MGHAARATGYISFAVGWDSKASGRTSVALGNRTEALGTGSFAVGVGTIARGEGSVAMGKWSETEEGGSFAAGLEAYARLGISLGHSTYSSGADAVAIGAMARATGGNATAIGCASIASGEYSTAIGVSSISRGYSSVAIGSASIASGDGTFAFGGNAKPFMSFVIGQHNDTSICYSMTTWDVRDPLFVVGNGIAPETPSNAFTVFKDGRIAIGNITEATSKLDVDGSARFRNISTGTGDPIVADAGGNLFRQASDISLKTDIQQITGAISSVKQLRGVSFSWVNDPDQDRSLGLIAQEVETTIPEVVFTNPVDGYKGVNYSEIVPVLIEAIKEQQEQIEALSKIISGMREEIASSSR
jgi:hypothetical protein